jgi:hypothetical protein
MQNSKFACPRCMTPTSLFGQLGTADYTARRSKPRQPLSSSMRSKIESARRLIFRDGHGPDAQVVKATIREQYSMRPTIVRPALAR